MSKMCIVEIWDALHSQRYCNNEATPKQKVKWSTQQLKVQRQEYPLLKRARSQKFW